MNEHKPGTTILRAQERSLVTDLFLRARQEGRPYFPVEEDAEAGRRRLRTVLADCDAFAEHLALLCKLFQARYRRAVPRQDRPMGATPRAPGPDAGFRFFRLLEEPKAAEIVELGVREKSPLDGEVAELLLNPFALDDLADRINEALPEVWLDDLATAGRAIRERYGLPPADVLVAEVLGDKEWEDEVGLAEMLVGMERNGVGAAKLTAAGANCWELTFGDEAAQGLARRLAEHAYGDAGQAFTLRLLALSADEAGVAFELVVAPVPSREALQVAVTFPGGQRRVFTVEVPPEVHEAPPDQWRPSMPSLPCEPILAEKLELRSGAWRAESGPPGVAELLLRS